MQCLLSNFDTTVPSFLHDFIQWHTTEVHGHCDTHRNVSCKHSITRQNSIVVSCSQRRYVLLDVIAESTHKGIVVKGGASLLGMVSVLFTNLKTQLSKITPKLIIAVPCRDKRRKYSECSASGDGETMLKRCLYYGYGVRK